MNIENGLRILGAERRRMGEEALRQIPPPCLTEAARTLVERAYVRGDFGERSEEWVEAKVRDLADCFQGTHEDWEYAQVKPSPDNADKVRREEGGTYWSEQWE